MTQISIAELYRRFKASSGVSIDSRKVQYGELFFCLKGANFNGNKFASKALELGASYAIIDEEQYYIDERTILVDNALEYLQFLASYHRRQFNIPFIGITGTNGKTTTKELVYAVLSKKFETYATQGNFNNHIGVPLTLLSIPENAEIAIIEMGANHIGEIAELCKMAEPNYGLITSIGKAHLEGFGSLQGVIKAKTELYAAVSKNVGKVFVNADNELLKELSFGMDRIMYGTKDDVDVVAKAVSKSPFATAMWNNMEIRSQLVGGYNFDNIMAAIAIGNYFQLSDMQIYEAITEYEPTNKRSQWLKTNRNELIVDSYNANPSSMKAALDSFEAIDVDSKWIILGDMLELGDDSFPEHKSLLSRISESNLKNCLLVGDEFINAAKGEYDFPGFKNTDELIEWLKQNPIDNSLILLKGSRGIALEKLIEHL